MERRATDGTNPTDRTTPPTPPADGSTTLPVPRRGSSAPTVLRRSDAAASNVAPAGPAVDRLGPYEIFSELGRGGMGVVYRARDTRLGRLVALKVLIAGEHASPEALARFHREAAVVARMGKHPHIVQVHDFGREGPRTYFTMDLVEGTTLRGWLAQERTPREVMELAHKVALALAHAHANGVVHRDLKGDNVLIDGAGEPQVTDFGLAREVEGSARLSLTGQLMGTPAYMAPEQAAGRLDEVGPWTDVYAFGAMLYEAFAGRPPHEGTSLASLLNAVETAEPVPLSRRAPRVSAEIDTLVARCMEKEPARRYPDGKALAEELARHLAGEPILARPISGWERAWRWVARHRTVALPSAAAVLIATAFGTYAVIAHFRHVAELSASLDRELAARRALEKAQKVSDVLGRWRRLSRTLAEMEGVACDSRLAADEVRARNRERWVPVDRFVADTPPDDASQSTMLALAGWALRLAGRGDEALDWMARARSLDAEVPYGALMEALVWFSRYVEAQPLPPFRTGECGIVPCAPPQGTAAMREARDRIVELLPAIGSAAVWGKEGSAQNRAAIEGMQAVESGDYLAAERALTRAVASVDLEPMQRSLLLARAKVRYMRKDFEGALADLEEISAVRLGQAEWWFCRGLALSGAGAEEEWKGGDPRPRFRAAIEAFGEALARDPRLPRVLGSRAVTREMLAVAEGDRGGDPREACVAAIADHTEVIRLLPGSAIHLNDRGDAYRTLGDAEGTRGGDPRVQYAKALDDFRASLALDPENADAYHNRSVLQMAWAQADAARGGDPGERLRAAVSDTDEAIRRDPGRATFHATRGMAYSHIGRWESVTGKDPLESDQKALADFDEAIRREPEFVFGYVNRGLHRLAMGDAVQVRRGDPRVEYKRAIEDFGEALARNPGTSLAYCDRGMARCKLAAADAVRGEDAREGFRSAIADFGEAVRRNPGLGVAFANRGATRQSLADLEAKSGGDPRDLLREAIGDYDRAIDLKAMGVGARVNRGVALQSIGDAEGARGEDPRGTYRAAIEEFERAIAENPRSLDAHNNRGVTWKCLGEAESARAGDPAEDYRRAIADEEWVLERNPSFWQARLNFGVLLELTGRPREAVEQYDAVLALVGDNLPPRWKEKIAKAREAAGLMK